MYGWYGVVGQRYGQFGPVHIIVSHTFLSVAHWHGPLSALQRTFLIWHYHFWMHSSRLQQHSMVIGSHVVVVLYWPLCMGDIHLYSCGLQQRMMYVDYVWNAPFLFCYSMGMNTKYWGRSRRSQNQFVVSVIFHFIHNICRYCDLWCSI